MLLIPLSLPDLRAAPAGQTRLEGLNARAIRIQWLSANGGTQGLWGITGEPTQRGPKRVGKAEYSTDKAVQKAAMTKSDNGRLG